MGGACSACGGKGDAYAGFWWGNMKERDHLEDPGMGGWLILKWISKKWENMY
jgi:hypothetical protein